ncbi:MAG: hypothetical protein IJB65_07410 [Clostridia bacterium]|nr:hypothetical protein [Clostridia bacterium]
MAMYKICGLNLYMSPRYEELLDRAAPFLSDGDKADIKIELADDAVADLSERTGLSLALAEYQLSCAEFCKALLAHGGFVLHASAVLYNGGVYLFSAPSGIGKSTHAKLWVKNIKGAEIINDDKPAIRIIDGVPYAFGTPWCGSGYQRLNACGTVKALYFLRRADFNFVKPMDKTKTPYLLFESMMRPDDDSDMDALFFALQGFLSKVQVLSLDCNTEDEAAITALLAVEEL